MAQVPRKIRSDLHTATERKIGDAMASVECMGAHDKLTRALIMLSDARDLIASYIDDGDWTTQKPFGWRPPSLTNICRDDASPLFRTYGEVRLAPAELRKLGAEDLALTVERSAAADNNARHAARWSRRNLDYFIPIILAEDMSR